MSDIDIFSGGETLSQSFSPEKYQEFLGRMQQAAADIQLIQQQEKQQKKKEDHLIGILSELIQAADNSRFKDLIVYLLQRNLPPVFILSLILLAFPDIGAFLSSPVQSLPAAQSFAVQVDFFPEELKVQISPWLKEISQITTSKYDRIRPNAVDHGRTLPEIIELSSIILRSKLKSTDSSFQEDQIAHFLTQFFSQIFRLHQPQA